MSNQTSSTDSAFKIPMAPQFYPSQAESLLFQDIIEEKAEALRNLLNDFLKVQPYRKFDVEFNSFLKRIRRIIIEGHRSGSNVSRITNSSQIAPLYARPSASFNYRPSTSFNYRPPTMSMVSSSDYGTMRIPENNFQPIESRELSNPFKPPDCLQPRVVLSRIDQSVHNSHESPSISATVIEVSQNRSITIKGNNTHEIARKSKSKSLSRNEQTARNTYSDVTFDENNENENVDVDVNVNDDNNSIESLLEDVGFKIVVGLTENNETSKKNNASLHHNNTNKTNALGNVEKFLSMWSLNMKLIKSSQQSNISKHVLILTGNLLGEDRLTVVEKRHEAGILEGRKENNLVKTKNGLYRLVGNIIGGSPNELYQVCLSINGIPRTWRNIVKHLTGTENKTKNLFDFSISSPAGPMTKPIKASVNLDASMTRKGTTYSKNITLTNHKRKLIECDETENNKIKHRKFGEHIPSILASTPKKPKKQLTMFETPSQILKNKFSQKICSNLNKPRKLNNINDSIHINKKRKSQSTEQISTFLKPKTPEKTFLSSNNSTKNAKQISGNSTVGSKNNTKPSNQTSINSSKISNNSATKSKNKTLENCFLSMRSSNNSKQESKMKTSINSTNHSVDKSKENVKVSKQTTAKIPKDKTATKNVSIVKEIKKKKVSSSKIALTKTNNKCVKAIKPKAKICHDSLNSVDSHQKVKGNKSKTKEVHCPPKGPSAEVDLFDCVDHGDYGNISDYNLMASPSKLSVASGNDKSRSVTPPLFNHQWSSSAKSLVASEPPTPLSKSIEAKALKRVKAPKITLEDEIKYNKKKNTKRSIDFKTVSNKINKMLEFGEEYDED
ncbi:Uncharacterized protein FWK35_00002611 [Aphis craccivora]|uniref:SANTA domain-containing protein n=1 Tax=Aphis craccivora TaxID=307492 RepID=A0A6G0ZME1_APHCR|nr:Uncharacterized protein FWK35_00002611 [Aphis craccivora]